MEMRCPQRHGFLDGKDLPVSQSGRHRKTSRGLYPWARVGGIGRLPGVSGESYHPAVGRSARWWGLRCSFIKGPVSETKTKDMQLKSIS